MSFLDIRLSTLLTLCAFSTCFAVIFGSGAWFAPVPQGAVATSDGTRVVITWLADEPPVGKNSQDPVLVAPSVAETVEKNEPFSFVSEMMAVPPQMGITFPVAANPEQGSGANPVPDQQATFVGVWAPDASSCSLQNFKDGLLPTVINLDGAAAGDTFCSFKNQQQTQTGWRIDALCSNKQEQWSTRVHLIMSGDRLIWKSKRGSQAYTRCMTDMRMAQAH